MTPDHSSDELEKLVASMREVGFGHAKPIVLYEGKVLDGRLRLRAAEIAGVVPSFIEWRPVSVGDTPAAFVLRNARSRSPSVDSRASLEESFKTVIQEASRERERSREVLASAQGAAEPPRSILRNVWNPGDPFEVFGLRRPPRCADDRPPSTSEKANLEACKIVCEPGMTRREVLALLAEAKRRRDQKLCTFLQCGLLRKRGFNPAAMTYTQAASLLNSGVKRS
ncbi:MAG TPA: ParB/RepB/Spo0J family partition protein [Phycisphaerales bacterium]|nr:ParB/RepB/Spo0J family partition protein [Phycisphaerales bacterium]